jgi:signal transduction histidine kinase
MLMPATAEFVSLCQSQVALLTQSLGAALAVVYLAEELTEDAIANLMPLVAYPEILSDWNADRLLALLTRSMGPIPVAPIALEGVAEPSDPLPDTFGADTSPTSPEFFQSDDFPQMDTAINRPQHIVLPLVHEDVAVGLLVTARTDRDWTDGEHAQIEQIAETLAIACALDQRAQWLGHDLQQQKLFYAQQRDHLDDLLHQFRNPLTALRTFGKLLIRRLLPGEEQRQFAESIVRESDRLQNLLEQFDRVIDAEEPLLLPSPLTLKMSPETAPPAALPPARHITGDDLPLNSYSLYTVLMPLLDTTRAIAQDRQIELHLELLDRLPPVLLNPRAFCEIFNNLVDNALKYTPSGGAVLIQSGLRKPSSRSMMQGIAIADTGPGIPPEDLKHLFERHYRGVQANTAIPGTGLGLAIAYDLAHQMNGTIEVVSPVSASVWVDEDLFVTSEAHPGTLTILWLPEAPPSLPSYAETDSSQPPRRDPLER